MQEAIKRAPAGILGNVLGGFTRAIRDDPGLIQCDGQTILDSLFDAIDLGLVPGREGYFIRYGGRCRFQSGYRGILKLVMQAGVKKVDVREVRQGDVFRVELGDDERIVHQMNTGPDRDKGPITHIYATALLADGDRKREIWTSERIDEHKRQFSEAWKGAEKNGKKDSPWHTSWLAMAQKTVLLALCKLLPQTTAMETLLAVERKAEDDGTLDAAFTVVSQAAEASDQKPQKPAPEQLEEGEAKPAAGITDAGQARLDALLVDLDAAEDVSTVQKRLETAIAASESVEEELEAKTLCDTRSEAIRNARGERSNKKQKQL